MKFKITKKFGQLIINTTKIYGPRITHAHCGHVRVLVFWEAIQMKGTHRAMFT